MLDTLFGPPDQWPRQDLIGFSDEFDPGTALMAYRCGVFPMPLNSDQFADQMGWWSPMRRAHLPLERLRVTRSLRQSARKYTTTVDRAFLEVIDACADPSRPDGWIDARVRSAFGVLHQVGYVHSVETWDAQGRLVGGLYGVHQNGMFAGESMFHDPTHGRDASKVALLRLAIELARARVRLLDVQWLTPHLTSLGAVAIPRPEYLSLLGQALDEPHHNAWRRGGAPALPGEDLLRALAQ
ncbi:MAG: leucyl/phenylalanyl-tRNA--protein transferase [Arachnia sp.]